jgi:hypothetical protein
MSPKASKHPKSSTGAQKRRSNPIAERLAIARRNLRLAPVPEMSNQATDLALRLLTVVARRKEGLDIVDAILGATTAAALTSLASGMSRSEFCAWLRRTADSLDLSQR